MYELDLSPQTARNRLGAFMFPGEDVFKLVGDLSGGEKSRLRLCMLMNNDINLLILDEPTNHLDLPSREWIEDAVGDYTETLVFISHDRFFIDRFATRIWELDGGVFTDFLGTYSDYRAQQAGNAAVEASVSKPGAGAKPGARLKPVKKAADVQKELRRLEREIEKLENELDEISMLKEEHSSFFEKLLELDEREQEVLAAIELLYAEWEQATQ